MSRSLEVLVAAVVLTAVLPIVVTRADVTRCETYGRCPAPVVVRPPPESDALRWLRDNDDDGSNIPLHDLDAGRRADEAN